MATISVSFDGQNLSLSDRGHTNASRSEQVIWNPGSGVHSVTNIAAKSSSSSKSGSFWSSQPAQNGVNFKGTISDSATGEWDYDICCNVGTVNEPIIKCIDPRIQILSS